MGKFLWLSWLPALVLCSSEALGQRVTLQLTPEGTQQFTERLGVTEAELQRRLEAEVRALYSVADVDEFLRLSANAQSMSGKGLGADYSSRAFTVLLGAGVNLTVDAGDRDLREVKALAEGSIERAIPVSAGAQVALLAGYAFQAFGRPLAVYANALAYPLRVGDLAGSSMNLGVHGQLGLLGPAGSPLLAEWGGLRFTTGIELSRTRLSLDRSLSSTFRLGGQEVLTSAIGRVELTQRALTVPLELSTSVRLLYFLTLYGGAALDLLLGSADMFVDVESALRAPDGRGGALQVGTARVEAESQGRPPPAVVRLMFGTQVHLGPLSVFGQLNLQAVNLTVGVSAGVRLLF